jgi:hypothetical protein
MTRVVLVDVSSSMAATAEGRSRRIDIAQAALDATLPTVPDAIVIAFHSVAFTVEPNGRLPEPAGGTNLAGAIDVAAKYSPTSLLVLSDGQPDNAPAALTAARRLNAQISTIFCGEATDPDAAMFLQELAWCSRDGLGASGYANLGQPHALEGELRRPLLGGPMP